jgi:hypothetical protein
VVYTPRAGDVLTATISGTSISTAPRQAYSLVASGQFYSGVWYCQSPLASRADSLYTTANCLIPCGALPKDPLCCPTTAGATCDASTASADTSICDPYARPWDCVSPSPFPTTSPTRAPTGMPTTSPTLFPTGNGTAMIGGWGVKPLTVMCSCAQSSGLPTRTPTAMPTTAPSRRPTQLPTTVRSLS